MIVDIRLIILVVTVFVNLLLATFVYKNNPKSATNKIFGVLSIVTSLWLVDVYFSVTPTFFPQALLWVRLSIFLAVPQIALFFLLSHTLPSEKLLLSRRKLRLLIVVTGLMMLNTFSPATFLEAEIVDNTVKTTTGPGMGIFGLFAVSMSAAAIFILVRKLRHSAGYVKEQYLYVMMGIILMLGLLIATVLVPVAVFNNSTFVPLVPLYTVIFLGATTYAIVKKRLFNIRAAVSRSVAYILLLATMASVYSLFLFGIINAIFSGPNNELLRQISSVILVIPMVLSFQSIKRFFDRVTNQLFYHDSYDTQEVLNTLGSLITAEIDLHKVLAGSKKVLQDALKSSFIEFVLFHGEKITFESDSRKNFQLNIDDVAKHIKPQRKDLLVTEEMEHSELKEWLMHDSIAINLRLKTQRQIVGYVLIGEKQSGDIYSGQDKKLLTIVANELAVAVQNALRFEEIEEFNLTLQQKVEDATRELRKTNEKLRELDETKDEFISMASHQLRTPLTSVKGYLSMVLEGDSGKITAAQQKLLDQAYVSSQRMVYLIADLLNVSRLRTGKFVIEALPMNLAEAIEGEIGQLKETAKGRGLELVYHKPDSFPQLMLDETKIRQVIMNFIDNAIYYTPSGGHITVNLKDIDHSIEFTVVDDGLGVPAAEQHHLFNKFYRAGNARKARPDGTGLGLFMAKKVVVAQGGNIIFKSTEGKGSTFGFSFAKAKLMPPAHHAAAKPAKKS